MTSLAEMGRIGARLTARTIRSVSEKAGWASAMFVSGVSIRDIERFVRWKPRRYKRQPSSPHRRVLGRLAGGSLRITAGTETIVTDTMLCRVGETEGRYQGEVGKRESR